MNEYHHHHFKNMYMYTKIHHPPLTIRTVTRAPSIHISFVSKYDDVNNAKKKNNKNKLQIFK